MPHLATKILALGLAAAALPPATAAATTPVFSGPANEYFLASVQATQRSSWHDPATTRGDCTETVTTTPSGSETVTLAARGRRLLVQRIGDVVSMRVGTWDPYAFDTGGWIAPGTTTRRDTTHTHVSPGNCNNDDVLTPLVKEDCGRRSRLWDLSLQFEPAARQIRLEEYPAASQPSTGRYAPFANCPVQVAGGLAEPDQIAGLDVAVPPAALSGGYGPHRFGGFRRWYQSHGGIVISTTVTWTVTLTRVHRG